MPRIKRLSTHEAQKIAAGQVVDRPANIVKELVENSIDADANQITISIEDGGKKLIRVVDNGCGMDKEDAQLCFEKHATSKITTVDELPTLTSFGFRGEALASIAAVSNVTLITKQEQGDEGIKVVHNKELAIEPIGCPQGTDIQVHNLFYNVPARAKFLKKRETETRHIIQFVQAISLAYPAISFKLLVDGKVVFNCPAQEELTQRVAQLWDQATAQHMIPIDGMRQDKGVSICGVISNHHWFRYDRSSLFFLVNNRWVTNHHLSRALMKGYDNVIPAGRYPMACISILINPSHIDINTHPRKEEIKFSNPRVVEQLINQTVRQALEAHLSKQIKKEVKLFDSQQPTATPFRAASFTSFEQEPKLQFSMPEPFVQKQTAAVPASYQPTSPSIPTTPQTPIVQPPEKILPILEQQEYTLIGQYHKTYMLIEQDKGLFLVDQHAAHERVLYELFAKRFNDLPTINLMFPQLINLSKEDIALIEPFANLIQQHGISLEVMSEEQIIINSTPVHLKDVPLDTLIKELIGWLKEYNDIDQEQLTKKIHDHLRAQMACKTAVKAGDQLTHTQMEQLLKDLYECPNRFSCPHGRPTGWLMPLDEIEKKFRRDYKK